jgi:GTP-binding protein
MIIGENSREADMDGSMTRKKLLSNMRASTTDEAIRLISLRELTLEKAIELIAGDEYVEVTPKSNCLGMKILDAKKSLKHWQGTRGSAESFA